MLTNSVNENFETRMEMSMDFEGERPDEQLNGNGSINGHTGQNLDIDPNSRQAPDSKQNGDHLKRAGQNKRWSCKEELSFYRTLMSTGVDSVDGNQFSWEEFRQNSKLDKSDEVLEEYFHGFVAMCKRTLGMDLSDKEELSQIHVEAISKDKATSVLEKLHILQPNENSDDNTVPRESDHNKHNGSKEPATQPDDENGVDVEPQDDGASQAEPDICSNDKMETEVDEDSVTKSPIEEERRLDDQLVVDESSFGKEVFQKRKLSEDTNEDKTKKKKRLDDIMFGLGASKGFNFEKVDSPDGKAEPKPDSFPEDDSAKVPELNKLKELLSRSDSSSDLSRTSEAVSREKREARAEKQDDLNKKIMQSLGLDEKMLKMLGLNEKMFKEMVEFQAKQLNSFDPKLFQQQMQMFSGLDKTVQEKAKPAPAAVSSSSGSNSADLMKSLGVDLKSLEALGMNAEHLKSMKLDPNLMSLLGMPSPKPPTSPFSQSAKGSTHERASGSQESRKSNAPQIPNSSAFDPKNLDLWTMAALGMDPKSLASLDPAFLNALYSQQLPGLGKISSPNRSQSPASSRSRATPSPAPNTHRPSSRSSAASPRTEASKSPSLSSLQGDVTSTNNLKSKLEQNVPKSSGVLDPRLFQFQGMDPSMLNAFGLKPGGSHKPPASIDPMQLMMSFPGFDPSALSQIDPKLLQAAGLDPKLFQNLKPRSESHRASESESRAARSSPAPKVSSPARTVSSSLPSASGYDDPSLFGFDAKLLQGLDPKTLANLGFDPTLVANMLNPKKMMTPRSSPINSNASGSFKDHTSRHSPLAALSKSSAASVSTTFSSLQSKVSPSVAPPPGIDPKLAAAFGLDPSLLAGLDPRLLDPKLLGFDPKLLSGMSLPGSSSLSFSKPSSMDKFGTLDSNLSSLYKTPTSLTQAMAKDPIPSPGSSKWPPGLDPKLFAGMDPKLLSGFDPRMMAAGMDPKLMSGFDPKLYSGMDPKFFGGLDPKLLMGMDPKLLASLDPKLLSSMMDPKLLAGQDPRSLASGMMDPKMLSGLDPKLLGGLDPKLWGGMFDPKLMSNLDPKFMTGLMDPKRYPAPIPGMDSKLLAGLDPKLMLDPKLLSSMDPKLLASFMDPKLYDPKMTSAFANNKPAAASGSDFTKSSQGLDPRLLAGMDPKMFAGMDPKLFAGLDPKLLSGMDPKLLAGMDPKLLTGMDPKLFAGMDPKLLAGLDPKLFSGLDPKLLAGMDPSLFGFGGNAMNDLNKMFGRSSPQQSFSRPSSCQGTTRPETVAAALEKKRQMQAVGDEMLRRQLGAADDVLREDGSRSVENSDPPALNLSRSESSQDFSSIPKDFSQT